MYLVRVIRPDRREFGTWVTFRPLTLLMVIFAILLMCEYIYDRTVVPPDRCYYQLLNYMQRRGKNINFARVQIFMKGRVQQLELIFDINKLVSIALHY